MSRRGTLSLVALAAALAVGCGHTTRSPSARVGAGAPAAPYRWLGRTAGTPPSVAAENARPGTTAWRLPGPPADIGGLARGHLAGYVAEQAVVAGQTERIYVNAPGSASVKITVFRIGWYRGSGGRAVLISNPLVLVHQPSCTHRFATGLTECDWHPTLSFTIPPALPSGVYIVKMSASVGINDCMFVVRARHSHVLLAAIPTASYEAYNAWGGDSLYPGGADRVGITGTTQGIAVSYDRPYDSITGAGQFFARDVAMVHFLEREGYPVSYTTSESLDQNPEQVSDHRALLDLGHSEYWSQRQKLAWARALHAGQSLLFFSSDTLAWRIRYAPASPAASQAGEPDHTIVAYKEYSRLDPNRSHPTGTFAGREAGLVGSAYLGCITPRLPQPGPPTYVYYPWHPAPGLRPAWLFAHTQITARTAIGGIVGYETDQTTSATPSGTVVVGGARVQCMPAAANEPAPGPAQDFAQTTIYTVPSGAIVFAAGTLGWELGLDPVPSASPQAPLAPDARVEAITRNLIAHVLRSRTGSAP